MNIDSNDPRITAYVFGELEGSERAAFEAELASSSALQEMVAATEKTVSLIASDLADAPPVRLHPEQRAAVTSRFSESETAAGGGGDVIAPVKPTASIKPDGPPDPVARPDGVPIWLIGVIGAAIAATMLFMVGATFWARNSSEVAFSDSLAKSVATDSAASPDPGSSAGPHSEPMPTEKMASDSAAPSNMQMKTASASKVKAGSGGAAPMDSAGGLTAPAAPFAADPFGGAAGESAEMAPAAPAMVPPQTGPSIRMARSMPRGMPRPTPAPAGNAMPAPGNMPAAPSAPSAPGAHAFGGGMGGMAGGGGGMADSRGGMRGTSESIVSGGDGEGGLGANAMPGDNFAKFKENTFVQVRRQPISTFSIDVDTASFTKVRQFLDGRRLPPADAIRLEELVNYFPYSYEPPSSAEADSAPPVSAHLAVSNCFWEPQDRLVRIALKAKEVDISERPRANLVFLIDTSGSMRNRNKLPLLKSALQRMTQELRDDDQVAIVTYSGSARVFLQSTAGSKREQIISALGRLSAGGSTNGGQGMQVAYDVARQFFIDDGINRVLLCTDGDFNVGSTRKKDIVELAVREAKTNIFLSILGFGIGNLNDAMLEAVSNKANGAYAFIDNDAEADRVLIEQMSGTLMTVAKDVKIQVDFNHAKVESYRMLGYENRKMRNRDFDDDTKDAGDMGAGHSVTMLYQVRLRKPGLNEPPVESKQAAKAAAKSKYASKGDESSDLLNLAVRYKLPDEEESTKVEFPLKQNAEVKFGEADADFRFASAVASFGMLLRNSEFRGDTNYDAVLEIAAESAGKDPLRLDLLRLVRQAKALVGRP